MVTFTVTFASHITLDPVIVPCFPEEEISNMRSELDKYGIQMPTFSKIGGILANELSVDEAARKSFVLSANCLLGAAAHPQQCSELTAFPPSARRCDRNQRGS